MRKMWKMLSQDQGHWLDVISGVDMWLCSRGSKLCKHMKKSRVGKRSLLSLLIQSPDLLKSLISTIPLDLLI